MPRRLHPGIEAILITGYASAESLIAAFAAGASDYLTKPFDSLAVVRAKIRAALDRRLSRAKDRAQSSQIAKEAVGLLMRGKDVPDPVWDLLELRMGAYETAIKEGGDGLGGGGGRPETVALLADAGFQASPLDARRPALDRAAVVVLETETPRCSNSPSSWLRQRRTCCCWRGLRPGWAICSKPSRCTSIWSVSDPCLPAAVHCPIASERC